jgi:hypothetical protein
VAWVTHRTPANLIPEEKLPLIEKAGLAACDAMDGTAGGILGGPGPSAFDALAAIEQWVENGKPPDRIPASQLSNGKVDRTRPLCAYPLVAKYQGKGSTDDAASFECRLP